MTDAADSSNTAHGDNSGYFVQAGQVRDINVGGVPLVVRVAAVVAALAVLAVLGVIVFRQDDPQQAAVTTSSSATTAPPSSSTTTAPGSSSAPADVVVQGTGTLQTAGPRPPTQRQQTTQPTVAPPVPAPATGPVKPATDGPGYLVPLSTDQRAADFYQNEWNDVVMWERHQPGDQTSFQPFWAREFSDANPEVFRLRNQRGNLCMEPVFQDGFGEHIKANACSWGNNAQLWQTLSTNQFAHVSSSKCLGTASDGSYANGTWLIVSLCSGSADQKWRIAR
ncbi:RICIN domain-containing protein [Lentzea sp. NPDC059081]|uniref:RICIN domain-containing protein n=1 Tax=Lentzea sp. NPDC059081 TaxID=3346719 RepID=UPI0036CCF16C